MVTQYGPTWVIAGFSVLSIVFGAGGFFVGVKIQNANSKEKHCELDKKITDLDRFKQSKVVCAERHTTVEVTFLAIRETLTKIHEDVKWLRERDGGK